MDLMIKKFLFDTIKSIQSIEKYLVEKRDYNIYLEEKLWKGLLKESLKELEKP